MPTVRISDEVAVPHLEHFDDEIENQCDHGGRAGYKSRKNALKVGKLTLKHPGIEAVIIRENYKDHKNSTFRDLIWAYKKLGINLRAGKHYPQGNELWIRLPNGGYIHFGHMKDIDQLKGYRPTKPENSINIAWFAEITQFKSERYITEAKAGLMRESSGWFINLYEWNDAPKLSHWTYQFLEKMKMRPDAYTKKTNYNDAPLWQQELFLGLPLLREIERLKEIDPEQYKSTYLGFPANLSGTVYKQFDLDRNVKPATHEYMDLIVGVDVGGNDATVFTLRGIKPNYKGEEIPRTYYHKNGVTGGIKNINEYVDDFLQFCEQTYAKYKKPITVFIDSANLMFIQLVEEYSYTQKYSYIVLEKLPKMKKLKGAKKEKTILQGRVDMNELKFGSGYTTIDPSCTELIKAIQEREYDKKGNPADDGSSDVDSIDSYDYTWIKDMDFIYDMIMR